MKRTLYQLLLPLLLLASWSARAQTTLQQESFEVTPGTGTSQVNTALTTTYTTAATGATNQYFLRTSNATVYTDVPGFYPASGGVSGGTLNGSYYYAGNAVMGPVNSRTRAAAAITLNPVSVSGKASLKVIVGLAQQRPNTGCTAPCGRMETNDAFQVQVRFNDSGNTGAWNTIAQFFGDDAAGAGTGTWRQDVDLDGSSTDDIAKGSPYMTYPMTDFSFNVAGGGNTMEVRLLISEDGTGEEFLIDNIRVTGVTSSNSAPVLANIETTPLAYEEGNAATQITNSLTITDDGTQISGATVRFTAGFNSTEDQLVFTNQSGITGSFNSGTGILTLTGTTSLANYQNALRAVLYYDSDANDAQAGTRTVAFQVTDAGTPNTSSSSVSRDIVVTNHLNAAGGLPYAEDFENDGQGTLYTGNFANLGGGRFYGRTNVASEPGGQWHTQGSSATTISGINNSYYVWGSGTSILSGGLGTITTKQTNTAGYINLNFSVKLAASNNVWESQAYLKVYYRLGGSSGTWIPLLSFRSSDQTASSGGVPASTTGSLRQDANPATTSGVPTGAQLTPTLTTYTATLPASANGQLIDFKIDQLSYLADGVGEVIGFDNLQLTGTQVVAPTVTTSAATTITTGSAVLGGNVTADGGASVTGRGVVYSNSNTAPTIGGTGVAQAANGSGTGSFAATISSLAPGTTYYVQAYATNSVGTSYGGVQTFTTPAALPTVTTTAATSITTTSAVLGGNVTAANGATVTGRGVVYSVTSTNGTPTIGGTGVAQAANGSGTGSFAATISSLAPGTSYSVQAYATNSAGTSYGGVQTFTTATTTPTVTTAAASSVTSSSAVLGGNVTADGGASVTGRGVVYSVTSTNGTPTIGGTGVAQAANGSSTGSFSATISGLTAGTSYSVQAYATNSAGTSYGGVQTFTTNAATVTSIGKLAPTAAQSSTGTATTTVSFTVTFSVPVSGVTASNFSLTQTTSGATITGVTPTTGSSATYTVTVNTGTGNGTLQLNVANATNITPSVTNTPYNGTSAVYTITKSFAAAPALRIQAGGSASGNSDVTAFVDLVQVLQSGTSTAVANALQNGSFETNNVDPNSFRKATDATPVSATPWSFTGTSGVSRNNSAFGSIAAGTSGDAVALVQSAGNNNASLSQNLAVPTGSYQVNFQAMQRNYTSLDQRLDVFVGDVFVGNLQPNNIPSYDPFTSATFSVTAPALTATVSTTSASPTSTSPIPFSVSFSQSVGTTFTASDLAGTITNGTVTSGSFSGSGAGPYTFTVTPTGAGTVTVSVAANMAQDANNTNNSASNSVSVQYQPVTAATVTTAAATSVTQTSAVLGGNVTADGGATVTGRGVVYSVTSTNGTPTIGGTGVTQAANGSGTGPFSATISSLAPSTSYSVQAYATNSQGTSYGGVQTFTTSANLATVTTTAAASITQTSAVLGGNVTTDGGATVTGRGVVYSVTSTNGTPTIGGTGVTQAANGSSTGSFSATISGLTAGTSYSVQAYATNSAGTSYGGVQTFTTQPAVVATTHTVTVQLDASGNGTLQADAAGATGVNNGSMGAGSLTYTIQKIAYARVPENTTLSLSTPNGANFTAIRFASYGTPSDISGNGDYRKGSCDANGQNGTAVSTTKAYNAFVGFSSGSLLATNNYSDGSRNFGDPCSGTPKALAVQAGYSADAASLSYACSEVTASGSYRYVLLTVTDANGNSNTAVAQVTVNAPPAISVSSINPGSAPRGATVTVSGSNLGGIGSTVTVNGAPATVSGNNGSSFAFVVPNTATIGSGSLTLMAPCSQTLSATFTVQQPATAAPVLNQPANVADGQPLFTGTAPAGSTVVITVVRSGGATTTYSTTATGSGSFSYTLTQAQALAIGTYTATATAQTSGSTVSAASNQVTFVVPTAGPTTVLTSTAPNPTTVVPISVTVTFSRNVFNFSASGVTASNSGGGTTTVTNFQVVDGKTYTFDVTPSTTGLVTVGVAVNVAQDSLNRNNQAATALTRQYNQPATAAPTITAPTNNSFTNQSVTISGTAPANSTVLVYILQNGTQLSGSPVTVMATSTGTFSLGPVLFPDATYQVYATAQNPNAAVSANSNTNTFTVDTSRPSVTITSSAGASGGSTGTQPIPFSVTFSESVGTSFIASDVTVTGGGAPANFSGSGAGPYTFTIAPTGIGSTVTVNVAQDMAQDQAGNGNAASATYSLRYAPALTATVSTTSASPTSTSPIPFAVTFSQSVGTTFTASDVTVANGSIVANSFSGSGAGPYTFTVTPNTASSTVTVSLAANVAQDAATTGNSASNSVSVQFQAPTITVAPASLPNGQQGVAYSTTFSASGGTAPYSYAISGTPPNGLTLSGATLSGTPTASGTYNFRITATDNSAAPGTYSGFRDYTITIAAPAVTSVVWTGTNSTDWFTSSNWSPAQVPDATIDAIIPTSPSGNRFPVIGANTANGGAAANARNVSIASGAFLGMSANTLTIAASLTNNGAFNGFTGSGGSATGGTVAVGGSTQSAFNGGGVTRFWNLSVGSNGAQNNNMNFTSVSRLLTLNGNLATSSNPFTLVSDATATALVVNSGGVVTGNATVQRYIDPTLNPNLGYRHVSPAISNATVASLTTGSYSPVVNPAYNGSATPLTTRPFPTVYGYDQSRLATTINNLASFDKGWFSPNATNDPLNVGQGYTVLIAANQTWNFTGTLNNGDQTLNLGRNSGATAANSGLAFVGNPYPSPLDWGQVSSGDRTNVDNVLYVYRSNNPANPYAGSYGSYNGGTFTGGLTSTVLAQGQGFFVRVTQGTTAGSLTFRNAQRVNTYQSPTYGRPAETRPLVRLALQGVGSADVDDAVVYFQQGATAAHDGEYDAEKLPNPSGLNVSTSVSADLRMAINGLNPLGTAQLVVPVAVGVPAAGSYTLKAAQLLNLATTPTYLRDKQTGAVVDLATQPSYQFTVSSSTDLITNRFELVFSPQQVLATATAALAQQVGLYPNPAKASAFVELPASLGNKVVTATLVDAVGRQVRTVSLPAQGAVAHQLDLRELPTGVYLLHLQTSAGTLVKKLTVE